MAAVTNLEHMSFRVCNSQRQDFQIGYVYLNLIDVAKLSSIKIAYTLNSNICFPITSIM